jgi:hypothetical protein
MKKTIAMLVAAIMLFGVFAACTGTQPEAEPTAEPAKADEPAPEPAGKTDAELAAECAALIDAIYVQERTDETDAQCAAAKAAWDALSDAQKELVEGEEADPDYFGRDTGDASKENAPATTANASTVTRATADTVTVIRNNRTGQNQRRIGHPVRCFHMRDNSIDNI